MISAFDFDVIEQKIREHKNCAHAVLRAKSRLEEVLLELKNLRKSKTENVAEKIILLNEERAKLKEDISFNKRQTTKLYNEAETLIFNGLNENFSEIYERQLSRLYGYKIQITYKNMGDDFDEKTCMAKEVVITKNKAQHLKVLRTLSFGIVNLENNYVEKKAIVEICAYSKKQAVGTVVPFDMDFLKRV